MSLTKLAQDQLDLFAEIDAEREAVEQAEAQRRFDEAPSRFDLRPRGFQARSAAFTSWGLEFGRFDCLRRSHAWTAPSYEYRDAPRTDRCLPAVLTAELGCWHYRQTCCCVGGTVSRGACLGCDCEGEPHGSESAAVEDAHDHSWPGWRELPVVPARPERGSNSKQVAAMGRWIDTVADTYPTGWLAAGGPIRTLRDSRGTRHVPYATGFGGWDLAVVVDG